MTENHKKFLTCLSAFLQKKLTEEELGICSSGFDCDDHRQAYYKARYLMSHSKNIKDDTLLSSANKEVDRAIYLIENQNALEISRRELDSIFNQGITLDALVWNGINIGHIYILGGQIKAMLGDYEGSLDFYKKYQLHFGPSDFAFAHQRLYLFRSCSKYTFEDLINNRLTVVRPSKLNDPFDCLIFPWIDCLDANCEEKSHVKPLTDSYEYYRIRSFVLGNPNKSFGRDCVTNQLMWSHYADEHRGICILYNFSENIIQDTDTRKSYFMKVDYANKGSKMNVDEKSITVQKGFATKSSNWKYENEVRLISYDCSNQSDFAYLNLDKESTIKAIFFGLRCSNDDMNSIKKIIGNGVKYYQMEKDYQNIYHMRVKKSNNNNL